MNTNHPSLGSSAAQGAPSDSVAVSPRKPAPPAVGDVVYVFPALVREGESATTYRVEEVRRKYFSAQYFCADGYVGESLDFSIKDGVHCAKGIWRKTAYRNIEDRAPEMAAFLEKKARKEIEAQAARDQRDDVIQSIKDSFATCDFTSLYNDELDRILFTLKRGQKRA